MLERPHHVFWEAAESQVLFSLVWASLLEQQFPKWALQTSRISMTGTCVLTHPSGDSGASSSLRTAALEKDGLPRR